MLKQEFERLYYRQLELESENLQLREKALPEDLSPSDEVQLYEAIPLGYLEMSESGIVQRVNSAAASMLELPRAHVLSADFSRFITPADLGRFHALIMQSSQLSGHAHAQYVLSTGRGKMIETLLLCVPGLRRKQRGVRVFLTTPLVLKLAEETLQRLESFAVLNPNPILEFSEDGTVQWYNEAARALAEIMGMDRPEKVLPPEATAIVRECLASGMSRVREESVVGNRHIYWSFFPVMPARVVHCYGTDITERLLIEANLRQGQKLESVSQLAAGIAHDFNNILTIIQGYTSLLLAQRDLPMEICEPLKQVSAASERATNLTRQLMTFSRKETAQTRAFDLNETVQSFSYLLRRLLGESITQQYVFAPNLPWIQADSAMIEQIILNLALNARDAMPAGGKLTVETSAVRVDEGYRAHNPEARIGTFACLMVSDTGKGIKPDILSRIFEPFFTTKESASGLGLSTVYGIVKQHQGWIEVTSQPGEGTTFKVFLPVSAPAPETARPPTPAALSGHETILVVEDEPALRELVVRQLRRHGYRILQAGSGSETLAMWPQHAEEVDLLFTDMVMSDGMTGRDLAETLLAQKPDLKVIYSSGYSLEVVEQDFALRKGAEFLQKPYDPATLVKLIRSMLDKEKELQHQPT